MSYLFIQTCISVAAKIVFIG